MSSSSPPFSLMSTSAYLRGIEADVRDFWYAFPCPPPWKPRLLTEVNSSRLDPQVSRTVQSFLAGKCDIQYVLSENNYSLEPGDLRPDHDLGSTYTTEHGRSYGGPMASTHQWCDTTCQLSFGCAVFLVVVAMLVAIIICTTRHRVRHKMAATRPSRQQLHLSTSASDAVNSTEFSNLEIHGEDEFVYPPFRHRGLPHPPGPCDPSCNKKWTCPNCSSCHPLMRMSPPDLYYSRGYSAVYETIDDDEEDTAERTQHGANTQRGAVTTIMSETRDSAHGCLPYHVTNPGVSTVQLRPRPCSDITANRLIAETVFNGQDNSGDHPSSIPRYFELENTCALSSNIMPSACRQNVNSFGTRNTLDERCNLDLAATDNSALVSLPYQQLLNGQFLHSGNHGKVQQSSRTDEIYKANLWTKSPVLNYGETMNKEKIHTATAQSNIYINRHPEDIPYIGHNICCSDDRGRSNEHQKQVEGSTCSSHICTNSRFHTDFPDHSFYPVHQLENQTFVFPQGGEPTPQPMTGGSAFCSGSDDPDLIKDASCHSRRGDQLEMTASTNDDMNDNSEVPLRKAVLALHPQYFAKTSAA